MFSYFYTHQSAFTTQNKCTEYLRPMPDKMSRNQWLIVNIWHFQVYNPTGFNKIEKVVKYNQTDVKLTVWDTSGEDNDVYTSFLSASNTCWEPLHCGQEKLFTLERFNKWSLWPKSAECNFWNVWWVCWLIITQVIVSGRSSLGNFDKASVIDSKPKSLGW